MAELEAPIPREDGCKGSFCSTSRGRVRRFAPIRRNDSHHQYTPLSLSGTPNALGFDTPVWQLA